MTNLDEHTCYMLCHVSCTRHQRWHPVQSVLGAIADVQNSRNYNWSEFIFSWLVRHIKAYKMKKGKTKSIGGCVFCLMVCWSKASFDELSMAYSCRYINNDLALHRLCISMLDHWTWSHWVRIFHWLNTKMTRGWSHGFRRKRTVHMWKWVRTI